MLLPLLEDRPRRGHDIEHRADDVAIELRCRDLAEFRKSVQQDDERTASRFDVMDGDAADVAGAVGDVEVGVDEEAMLLEPEPHIPDMPEVCSMPEVVDIPDIPDDVVIAEEVDISGDAAVAGAAVPAAIPPPS